MSWRKLLIILAAVLTAFAVGFWFFISSADLQNIVIKKVEEKIAPAWEDGNFLRKVAGFVEPRYYLILFLNNTEIRPGGGFIGAYAVVNVDKGSPRIVKVEGTEILDNSAPKDFVSEPPRPIADYLKVSRWYFRDSNWSPDFAVSAAKSLELYKKEKGAEAENIDAVIGITPTVLEEILKISGPITVNGEEFNAKNFVEKLEYEVEYNYAKRGINFSERKKMLYDLTHSLMNKLAGSAFLRGLDFYRLAERMIKEKQAAIYFVDAKEQAAALVNGWTGEMKNTEGDYLFWVDANMGALKTDVAIQKKLSYGIAPGWNGRYIGKVAMKYTHTGQFDWRTSRYRTYARVYLPEGSELFAVDGSMKTDKSAEHGIVDSGTESGRQWFGTFISIEPGKIGELSFSFFLAPKVIKEIEKGDYILIVPKQLGVLGTKLTLDLNFGKGIVSASPAEAKGEHGDGVYKAATDLNEDVEFRVKCKN